MTLVRHGQIQHRHKKTLAETQISLTNILSYPWQVLRLRLSLINECQLPRLLACSISRGVNDYDSYAASPAASKK